MSAAECDEQPWGSAHGVANRFSDALMSVEVQVSDYFGEDDIERPEDDYGLRS